MKKSGKKSFIVGLTTGLVVASISLVFANTQIQAILNNKIKVSLNGQIQEFRDESTNEIQYPITYHDRTYLPLRTLANLVGVSVDYDANSNTAILNDNGTGINEIDISKGGECDDEYKEELKTKMSSIKNALVNAGEFKLKSAYNLDSVDDYQSYWGTSYRYGGGLTFNADNTFLFTLGAYADTFDRGGKYIIDMYNNKVIYVFYDGTIEYGTFNYDNGKINEVLYVDASYYSEIENDKLMVKLVPEVIESEEARLNRELVEFGKKQLNMNENEIEKCLIDIDSDGINELVKIYNDEPHITIWASDYHNANNIISLTAYNITNNAIEDLSWAHCSIYETKNIDTNKDKYFLSKYIADGLCYEDFKVYTLEKAGNKLLLNEILWYTCDSEIEETLRAEILKNNTLTDEEHLTEMIVAHTVKYNVEGNKADEVKYNTYVNSMKKKYELIKTVNE